MLVQVFVSRGQLGKTALACATSCMATDQWAGLIALLQAAQTALEGQGGPELDGLATEMKQVSLMFTKLHVPCAGKLCLLHCLSACVDQGFASRLHSSLLSHT